MAEVAVKQRQTYLSYLEALLAVELEERERNTIVRRIKEAHFAKDEDIGRVRFFEGAASLGHPDPGAGLGRLH